MTFGPAAYALVGFLTAIGGVTFVFAFTETLRLARRRGRRGPPLG